MDALGFLRKLKQEPSMLLAELSAEEYFETDEGKQMIYIISQKVRITGEKSFLLEDWGVIRNFQKNSLYKGRDFIEDMQSLGFSCEIVGYHLDEAPIKTYLFKVK